MPFKKKYSIEMFLIDIYCFSNIRCRLLLNELCYKVNDEPPGGVVSGRQSAGGNR